MVPTRSTLKENACGTPRAVYPGGSWPNPSVARNCNSGAPGEPQDQGGKSGVGAGEGMGTCSARLVICPCAFSGKAPCLEHRQGRRS